MFFFLSKAVAESAWERRHGAPLRHGPHGALEEIFNARNDIARRVGEFQCGMLNPWEVTVTLLEGYSPRGVKPLRVTLQTRAPSLVNVKKGSTTCCRIRPLGSTTYGVKFIKTTLESEK